MKMVVCSIYDLSVKAFSQPFYQRSKGEAIRSFSDLCEDEKSNLCKHPSDFVLFWLGDFDDQAGTWEQPPAPEKLATALDFSKKSSAD